MGYRTYVNGYQIFGNNVAYAEWFEFIESQGIEIDEDGCYEGEITDFMEMLQVVEKITFRLERERREKEAKIEQLIVENNLSSEEAQKMRDKTYGIQSIFDLRHIYDDLIHQEEDDKFATSLFDKLSDYLGNGFMFMPYSLYLACKNKLKKDKPFSVNGHLNCYKVKTGKTITIRAG